MGLDPTFTPTGDVQKQILEILGAKVVQHGVFQDDFWIQIQGEDLIYVVETLKNDEKFSFRHFVDLCGVDYHPQIPRFEVVIHLYSLEKKHRIRIRAKVPDDSLTIPTLTSKWHAANWQERETYDNYGIRFAGHPNLTRILNAPDMTMFPQRKEIPLRGTREVEEDL